MSEFHIGGEMIHQYPIPVNIPIYCMESNMPFIKISIFFMDFFFCKVWTPHQVTLSYSPHQHAKQEDLLVGSNLTICTVVICIILVRDNHCTYKTKTAEALYVKSNNELRSEDIVFNLTL